MYYMSHGDAVVVLERPGQSYSRGKVSEKKELLGERIPDICREPCSIQLSTNQLMHVRKVPTAREGTVQNLDLEGTVSGTHTEVGTVPESLM